MSTEASDAKVDEALVKGIDAFQTKYARQDNGSSKAVKRQVATAAARTKRQNQLLEQAASQKKTFMEAGVEVRGRIQSLKAAVQAYQSAEAPRMVAKTLEEAHDKVMKDLAAQMVKDSNNNDVFKATVQLNQVGNEARQIHSAIHTFVVRHKNEETALTNTLKPFALDYAQALRRMGMIVSAFNKYSATTVKIDTAAYGNTEPTAEGETYFGVLDNFYDPWNDGGYFTSAQGELMDMKTCQNLSEDQYNKYIESLSPTKQAKLKAEMDKDAGNSTETSYQIFKKGCAKGINYITSLFSGSATTDGQQAKNGETPEAKVAEDQNKAATGKKPLDKSGDDVLEKNAKPEPTPTPTDTTAAATPTPPADDGMTPFQRNILATVSGLKSELKQNQADLAEANAKYQQLGTVIANAELPTEA